MTCAVDAALGAVTEEGLFEAEAIEAAAEAEVDAFVAYMQELAEAVGAVIFGMDAEVAGV